MAFNDPQTFALITQPIGIQGIQFWSYQTDDTISEVMVAGYFTDIATYGAHIGDLVFCVASDGSNSFAVSLTSIDVAGDGTALHVEDYPIASQEEAEEGTDNVSLMTPLRTSQAITAQRYDAWADAMAATIPAEVDVIHVGGHSVPGRGAALFKRVVSAPTHAAKFTSNGGTVNWELAEAEVTPEMLGAAGDETADDTQPVTDALNFLITRNSGVLRPVGRYRLDHKVAPAALDVGKHLEIDGSGEFKGAFVIYGTGADVYEADGTTLISSGDSGIVITSSHRHATFKGYHFGVEPGVLGAGKGLHLLWPRSSGGTTGKRVIDLHHINMVTVGIADCAFKQPLKVAGPWRPQLSNIAQGVGEGTGNLPTADYCLDISETYFPEIYNCRFTGPAIYGVMKKNTGEAEAFVFENNVIVAVDYGIWLENSTGVAISPLIHIANNHINSRFENVHIDGYQTGMITGNAFYQAAQSRLTYTWTGDVLTVSTWRNNSYVEAIEHKLVAGKHVTFTGMTDPTLDGTFVVASVPAPTTYTFAVSVVGSGASGNGTIADAESPRYDIGLYHAALLEIYSNTYSSSAIYERRALYADPAGSVQASPFVRQINVHDEIFDPVALVPDYTIVAPYYIGADCTSMCIEVPTQGASYFPAFIEDLSGTAAVFQKNDVTVGSIAGLRSLIKNPTGRVRSRTAAPVGNTISGLHDCWFVQSELGNVTPSQLSAVADGIPDAMRLANSHGAPQHMGYTQIIESADCIWLRGGKVVLHGYARRSQAIATRFAILEWTGAADTAPRDIVDDWLSTNYTPGAGNFFINSPSLVVAGTGTVDFGVVDVGAFGLPVNLTSALNNLIVFVWTVSTRPPGGSTGTLDLVAWLTPGSQPQRYPNNRPLSEEQVLCSRYVQRKTVRTENGSRHIPMTRMFSVPTVTVSVGTATNASVDGFELSHSAAADCDLLSVAEL